MTKKQKKQKNCVSGGCTLGQRVRNLRKNKGLNQKQLAKKIGYKYHTSVSNIEADRSPPDIKTLAKIAESLDADLHWLVTGKISPVTQDLLTKMRPYAMAYLSDLASETEGLRSQIKRLELGEMFKGEDNAKKISELRKAMQQTDDEFYQTVEELNEKFVIVGFPAGFPKSDQKKE